MDLSDLQDELNYFDDLVFSIFKKGEVVIAGGAFTKVFTGQKPNDIDLFFKTEEAALAATHLIKSLNYKITFENEWVTNFKVKGQKCQIVKKYYAPSLETIIDQFDFTICKFAYDGVDIAYNKRFFKDLAKSRLVIDGLLVKPLNTLKRSYKYIGRGFTICPIGMAKLAKAINALEIDWDNPDQNTLEFYPDGHPSFRGID
jgi:hypothetical protein